MARMTRAERQAQTRERLLDAAREAFVRDGFHGASIDRIAGAAGFTTGALYSNFATKADLFLAAYERWVAERAREIGDAIASAGGAGEPAAGAARQWMQTLARDPDWFPLFLEFCAHAARDDELRRRFAVPLGAVRLTIAGLLEEELEADPDLPAEQLATGIKALGNGLALEQTIDPGSVPAGLFEALVARLLAAAERKGAQR